MTHDFDLIVLGAGSAGLTVAQRSARHGARVALFDPDALGGTCVNRGCVPKKALWFAAELARAQVLASEYGFDVRPGRLDWAQFCALRSRYIERLRERYGERLAQAGVRRICEAARFVAADTVQSDSGGRYRAPHIVIATGARPRRLDVPGFALGMVSDDVFDMPALPRRIGIVGGGYVATEFACLLQALGCEVELLIRQRLLDSFDAELAQTLGDQMQARGIAMTTGADIAAARGEPGALLLDAAGGAATAATMRCCGRWGECRTPTGSGLPPSGWRSTGRATCKPTPSRTPACRGSPPWAMSRRARR